MSNIARSIRLDSDQERIRLWRLERQKIAEVERQKRIADREKEKAEAAKLESAKIAELAKATAPTADETFDFDRHLAKRSGKAKRNFIGQAVLIVGLPMAALIYFYFWVATPLFQSSTTLKFDHFDTQPGSAEPSVFANRTTAGLQLAFSADAYINSPAMAEFLEGELGLLTALSGSEIDPLTRLRSDAWFMPSQEFQMRRFVQSSVDVQTGFLRIEVNAFDDDLAFAISRRIISAVQERVSSEEAGRSSETRASAEENLLVAEDDLREARAALVALQVEYEIMDPSEEFRRVTSSISAMEEEIADLSLEIARSEISGRQGLARNQQDIALQAVLTEEVGRTRAGLTEGDTSLSRVSAMFAGAELEIELAERRLDSAHQALAEISATTGLPSNQVSVVVPTQISSSPAYPRKLSGLLTAFVILSAVFFFTRLTIFRPRPELS